MTNGQGEHDLLVAASVQSYQERIRWEQFGSGKESGRRLGVLWLTQHVVGDGWATSGLCVTRCHPAGTGSWTIPGPEI